MRIGELAQLTDTSERSLRHYERLGLISANRDTNGYRRFDDDVVPRVRTIRHLLEFGFSLAEISEISGCLGVVIGAGCPSAREVLAAKLAHIRHERDRLSRTAERIEAAITASQVSTLGIPNYGNNEKAPT